MADTKTEIKVIATKPQKEVEDTTKTGTFLPNKKVRIVPNPRAMRKFQGREDHDGSFMFTGASVSWVLPQDSLTGKWINPFNNDDERKFIEEKLRMNLDTNQKKNDFETFRVRLKKEVPELENLFMELDLNNPEDYLKYLVLRLQEDVIEAWKPESELRRYRWLIKEDELERDKKVDVSKLKTKALKWLEINEKHPRRMFNTLRVFGKKNPTTITQDELYVQLYDIIDKDYKGLVEITRIIEDSEFDTKVLVEDAVQCRVFYKNNLTYFISSTSEKIGGLVETISYIKDPQNSTQVEQWKNNIKIFKAENNIKY